MFNVGRLLKSVQILTTCESFQCRSRWQHQSATSICPRLPCIPISARKRLFIRVLRHGRARIILILFEALKDLSLKALEADITDISFTKTVAVSLNEAPALRDSIMDDRGYGTFSSMHFQNSKLRFKTFPVHIWTMKVSG